MLRTIEGLPREFLTEENQAIIAQLTQQGLLDLTDTHLRLTGEGPLLVDSIASELA